jgi:hypothetical protein
MASAAAGGGNMNAGFGVISYNMSVFSAMGDKVTPHASEYSFLQRATVTPEGPTDFFMNALTHLHKNATAPAIDAKVIGIQEFHPPTLTMILDKLNTKGNFAHHAFSKEIMNKASVLTIWDKDLLGDISGNAYDEDLIFRPDGTLIEGFGLSIKKTLPTGVILPMDEGRPISIIRTIKGYLLINFHGINRPKYKGDGKSETGIDNANILKSLINIHCELAKISDIDPKKIIIMCDSNDRTHGIMNTEPPLIINGAHLHDGHIGEDGAISCCYNWDSCGIKPDDISPEAKATKNANATKGFSGKISLGDDGAESKYVYTGDYVLSTNFIKSVTAVESPLDKKGASIASDHKLVYAILPMSMAGGRRKNRTRKSKGKKSKKSRKH